MLRHPVMLVLACALIPVLLTIPLLLPGVGDAIPYLRPSELPRAATWLLVAACPVLCCAMADGRRMRAWAALVMAGAVVSTAALAARMVDALYPPLGDSARAAGFGAVASVAALGLALGTRRAGLRPGVAVACVIALYGAPPLLWYLGMEFANQSSHVLLSASPGWAWASGADVPWAFVALGGAGGLYALFGDIRTLRRARRRRVNAGVVLAIVAVVVVGEPLHAQGIHARFAGDGLPAGGTSTPLFVRFDSAPESVEIQVHDGPLYRIERPGTNIELPVFLPQRGGGVSIRANGEEVSLVPRMSGATAPGSRRVAIFAHTPDMVRGLIGTRLDATHRLTYQPAEEIPTHWSGLGMRDAVMIVDPESIVLRDGALRALADYLSSGGLAVVIGSFLFKGARADAPDFAPPGAPTQATLADGTTLLAYRYGPGMVIQLRGDVMLTPRPGDTLGHVLEYGWGHVAARELGWRADAGGASTPRAFGLDFSKHTAQQRLGDVRLRLLLLLAALGALAVVSSALRGNPRVVMWGAVGVAVVCAAVWPLAAAGEGREITAHAVTMLVGDEADAPALAISIVAADPNGRGVDVSLAAGAWATPWRGGGNGMIIESHAGGWSVHLPAGMSVRCDRPLRREQVKVLENHIRIDNGYASFTGVGHDERRRVLYTGLVDELSARLTPFEAAMLRDWLDRHVTGDTSWDVWFEPGEGKEVAVDGMDVAATRRLVYRRVDT